MEPRPLGRPIVMQELKGHPVRDEQEVADEAVVEFYLGEMESPKHGRHKQGIQDPSQYGCGGGVPHPPGGQHVPHQKGREREPEHMALLSFADAFFHIEQWHQGDENQWSQSIHGPSRPK